ncbi:alpha/beta hydrolase [Curtobacterium sp. Leaf261]|uniref:alpha/beta hydrolase n=1 Tax=Curtobacterium sp. Leaf261 TaxID=1736311 RepID=UPI0006FB4FFB|nr:alpha/beta fold hydrolase [Curtobacterium sp. Leaf261]KQO61401.1 hypothetical protein ASF23_13070 [Curtobacterium sp. Leaf261]
MRRLVGALLATAAAGALVAGVLPGVADVARTDAVLADTGEVAPSPLRLRAVSDSPVAGLRTGFLDVPELGAAPHRVRVGVVEPEGAPRVDVLFLHGHADRLDNHAALFAALAADGVRVTSFDMPSHGLTDAGVIDRWSFGDLAALAASVERATADGSDRPFVLAGWSFGGLLATRIVQSPSERAAFGRPISALAVESPAIVPLPFSGGDGVSKLRALTHDLSAPVAGPPQPPSPLQDPVFAGRLLANGQIAATTPLPRDVPTLVELADPTEDSYVDVAGVDAWATGIARRDGAPVTVLRCVGARHALDLESWPIGPEARTAFAAFVASAASGTAHLPTSDEPARGATCR